MLQMPSNEQFAREFKHMVETAPPVLLQLTPQQAWGLFCTIQLASRHPGNRGATRQVADEIARLIEGALAITPALKQIAAYGWREEFDVPSRPLIATLNESSPRYNDWIKVFGTNRVQVKAPGPLLASVPGHPECRVYLLDWRVLNITQYTRLVTYLAVRSNCSRAEVEACLDAEGVAILDEDLSISFGSVEAL